MSPHALLLVLTIHAMALISPGPDFAVITRLSIVSGRGAGIAAAAGVASAIGLYVLSCLLGLSLLLHALPMLSWLLSVVGAVYLAYLGIQCLTSQGALPEADPQRQKGKAFLTGFLTNLLNPKAMVYFGSILSQILKPNMSLRENLSIFALLVMESFLWFAFVAWTFSSPRILDWLRLRLKWFERLVGVALIGLAVKMASVALV